MSYTPAQAAAIREGQRAWLRDQAAWLAREYAASSAYWLAVNRMAARSEGK